MVIESARSTSSRAWPWSSVISSGRQSKVSGKFWRTRTGSASPPRRRGRRGQAELLQVVHRLGSPCRLAGRLDRGEQQGDQDRQDQDDDRNLDQGHHAPDRPDEPSEHSAVRMRTTHAAPRSSDALRWMDSIFRSFSG